MAAVASSGADSFITEGQVEEEVAHGLVGVPYRLTVVATRLSKAQRMMWDKTTTKTSALASSDRSGPLKALCSPAHRGDALLSTRSDARRSTNGTTARLRLLGRELARAEQLPPPRPPAPKPPHPPSSCAKVTRSRLAVCKNQKNEGSEKAGSCHWRPGQFVRAAARARARSRSSAVKSKRCAALL